MSTPLIDYFKGTITIDQLRQRAAVVIRKFGGNRIIDSLAPTNEEFRLTSSHLVGLCDLGIEGRISQEELADISFWIGAADEIVWDENDEVVAETLLDWARPEVNYPITPDTLARFKKRLQDRNLAVKIVGLESGDLL